MKVYSVQDRELIHFDFQLELLTVPFLLFKSLGTTLLLLQNHLSSTILLYNRILQVMMLRAKFDRIRIRINLLQRCVKIFCHFNNEFCYKIFISADFETTNFGRFFGVSANFRSNFLAQNQRK